jgi:hypothetical protein
MFTQVSSWQGNALRSHERSFEPCWKTRPVCLPHPGMYADALPLFQPALQLSHAKPAT